MPDSMVCGARFRAGTCHMWGASHTCFETLILVISNKVAKTNERCHGVGQGARQSGHSDAVETHLLAVGCAHTFKTGAVPHLLGKDISIHA